MRRVFCNLVFAITITGFIIVNSIQPAAAASIDEKLERLEKLLQQQQQQIESQSRTIQQLENKLGKMTTSSPAATGTAEQQTTHSGKPAVQSGNEKVSVKLYGQLNRGVLLVDDGDSTNTYQVDNDNSSTRVGLLGSVSTIKDWTIGTKFELEFESNSSSAVNQDEQNGVGGDSFNERWADIFINSPYGMLSLGQGDTASNNTSEIDLSGTTVAGYSDPNSQAGGHFFYDNSTKSLDKNTKIKDVFSNLDGLSRDDRIRYDTPEWRGLKLATSATSGDGGDVALFYTYKSDTLKLAAGAAYSNPGNTSSAIDETINGSVSLLHSSGVNLTLAGGVRELKDSQRDDPTFFYTKLGYKNTFCTLGETAMSIDFGINEDVNLDGDEAQIFSAQLVQYISPWATDFYLTYRNYELDRSGTDFENIHAVLSGLRVKF
ncbi:porin [Deltaproteobacteria bacterium IMCC39524]|nr:porin [Deltaproteobacteria bacterium IMCC39524]